MSENLRRFGLRGGASPPSSSSSSSSSSLPPLPLSLALLLLRPPLLLLLPSSLPSEGALRNFGGGFPLPPCRHWRKSRSLRRSRLLPRRRRHLRCSPVSLGTGIGGCRDVASSLVDAAVLMSINGKMKRRSGFRIIIAKTRGTCVIAIN